jgi:hypothetical protein
LGIFDNPATAAVAGQEDGALGLETVRFVNGTSERKFYFYEPFNLRVTITSRYNIGGDRWATRTVSNDTALRSRVNSIYVVDPTNLGGRNTATVTTIEYKRR